ncbi:MAG TPA: adenylate/guanylate cyclase domain-containing protein [Stellaceae bacterium]
MNSSRRLAAILAADVAGYSRLMGADEEGTLARLKAVRAGLIDPAIAGHNGRIVKTTGDGLLVEFASVVDAMRCAIQWQAAMAERAEPADARIEWRIGVNLGDVIIDGDDIFGDGVNIAARLEAMAEPGGICISRTVLTQTRGKLDFPVEDLGDQVLKNIAQPVHVFRVLAEETKKMPEPAALPLPTSRRSRSCRSRTCPATPSRNTSPTAWSRRSSQRCRASAGCSSSPAIRAFLTRANPRM